MSCNGCRVLRKGCSDSCVLRPCLQWIDGAEAQGHATVFVAKFFGRAGLMGFINAVPDTQRPALFQSLLYEACGRTVNPVFGAVGLLYSGNWHICQAAVEAVLKGGSLQPINHPNPKANAKSGAAKAMASIPVASFNVVNFGHSQARELFMPPQANQTSVKGCAENANLGSTDVQNLVQAQSGVQMTSDPRTALYWQRWSANGASTDNGVKGHHINRKREGAEINNVAKKAYTEDGPNHMLTPDAPEVAVEGDSVCPRTPQVPQLADEQEAVPSKANKVDLDLSLAPHANSQQEQQLQQGEQVQQDQPQQQQQPQQHQLAHEEQQQGKVARNASSPCRSMCSEGSVTSLDTNATDLTILAGGTNITF